MTDIHWLRTSYPTQANTELTILLPQGIECRNHSCVPPFQLVFYCCVKHYDQKPCGAERVYLAQVSIIMSRNSSRNLGAGTDARSWRNADCWLLLARSVCFLIPHRPTCPRVAPFTDQPLTKKLFHRLIYGPILLRYSLNRKLPLSV